jgi:hypothetical protein
MAERVHERDRTDQRPKISRFANWELLKRWSCQLAEGIKERTKDARKL